ncbi:MAG: DegT/DnrJ/EryC1/StrS family aminotransferase [Methanobacterium sp.]
MKLHFKKTSYEARKAMSETAMNIDHAVNRGFEEIRLAQDKIRDLTNHDHVKIVNSGNSAILAAMASFKDKIMIPDQGGWTGFKYAAKFLGLEIVEIPTELGIIKPGVLDESINENKPEALFITSFAGYIADQPVKQIYEICEDQKVTLVEDASGGIGDMEKQLSNGDHAHIIVASTGSPKIVNVGSGGFISTNDNEIFRKNKFLIKSLKADHVTCAGISAEIKNAPEVLLKYMEACTIIKEELSSAIHRNKRGISVALKTENSKKVGYELRQCLNADGRSIITTCPRYERVMVEAVCLEIKNLDPGCLQNSTINEIIRTVKDVTEII